MYPEYVCLAEWNSVFHKLQVSFILPLLEKRRLKSVYKVAIAVVHIVFFMHSLII